MPDQNPADDPSFRMFAASTPSIEQVHEQNAKLMADSLAIIEQKMQTAPGTLTINEWLAIIADFDREKFGHIPVTGTMLKLVKEMAELLDAPKDGSEYADVFILIFSIARRSGLFDLATPLAQKLIEIRPQTFVMQPDGTGKRIKNP